MSDAPHPYTGRPSDALLEEKHGPPSSFGIPSPTTTQPQSMPVPPPDCGPPPYEPAPQPGFIPLHMPTEGSMPYMPHGYCPPPGPHSPMGYYPPIAGHYPSPSGHTATVFVPSGAATTVTVLQGEIFQGTPVQTVCPHCQQAVITRTSHEIGLMNLLLCCFCCAVGCDLGCCLIPCVMDEFKDVMHSCPNCKAYIYTYKRMC
ncbi:cell death-inducing p53-target protein 1 [Microcaecilia unicolor]|uniref:Cell death-inducing p53-target protein 1 n=1 Tax=Microcaecilia unicolor TaxID=1415580 RepID=A0A6P7YYL6_9AMPH|nr:cell death-inducing p53-target protein 1 [Microcaecilia unicolor]XP_030068565.1 cell death-inducing p53-target protein 1 [Microcaecilia unicolor]XP_030068566.1 cell death-inducing p53-target protein 1 [Microcaecilia unicolor]XP_030068567.1 cell death-inducing p53-target protein 1 [Microcaecilia unicolor]XP_030068569.1 cell death-inducing p53-target protein 1 [Microcaecilia unicolor]XP_030068570.1 cell death-inducing p53-target protein 1 [Microcaecilia unicolor]